MSWKAFEVVFRLRTPLHSGWRKVGNLLMTRPYVTGRMLWGALTMRLTRNEAGDEAATDSGRYEKTGELVHEKLAFTYFYPALKAKSGFEVNWPWEGEADFRRRFLGGYAGTALNRSGHAAAEGTLHEVEFISPHTIDDGKQVYLAGYIFERGDCRLNWRSALRRIQFGGERGYGWGAVEPLGSPNETDCLRLFGNVSFKGSGDRPLLSLEADARLLAHTAADPNLHAEGEIEPLVGREWRTKHVGQDVGFSGVCFVPGSKLSGKGKFQVGRLGIWKAEG